MRTQCLYSGHLLLSWCQAYSYSRKCWNPCCRRAHHFLYCWNGSWIPHYKEYLCWCHSCSSKKSFCLFICCLWPYIPSGIFLWYPKRPKWGSISTFFTKIWVSSCSSNQRSWTCSGVCSFNLMLSFPTLLKVGIKPAASWV